MILIIRRMMLKLNEGDDVICSTHNVQVVGKENETRASICYQVGTTVHCWKEKYSIWSQ